MQNRISLIVVYAIALHLLWFCMIWFDYNVNYITAIHALQGVIHPPFARFAILAAAVCALVGLFTANRKIAATLMVPQQVVLFISAGGALISMAAGVFPDGAVRTSAFLIADQAPAVIAALLHTVAIFRIAKE